jgi:ribosomal protein L34E
MNSSTCPRCGAEFHCGVKDTEPCWCNSLTLSEPTQQVLRARYTSCLCENCLRQLEPEDIGGQHIVGRPENLR